MKLLHWIILAIAGWVLLVPFIGDDIINLILNRDLTETELINLIRWDDLFLGLAITIIALFVITLEQASHRTPGLKAMHWLQMVLGLWIAIAPFALQFNYEAFTWSHFVAGGFVAVFALLQITFENRRNVKS